MRPFESIILIPQRIREVLTIDPGWAIRGIIPLGIILSTACLHSIVIIIWTINFSCDSYLNGYFQLPRTLPGLVLCHFRKKSGIIVRVIIKPKLFVRHFKITGSIRNIILREGFTSQSKGSKSKSKERRQVTLLQKEK